MRPSWGSGIYFIPIELLFGLETKQLEKDWLADLTAQGPRGTNKAHSVIKCF